MTKEIESDCIESSILSTDIFVLSPLFSRFSCVRSSERQLSSVSTHTHTHRQMFSDKLNNTAMRFPLFVSLHSFVRIHNNLFSLFLFICFPFELVFGCAVWKFSSPFFVNCPVAIAILHQWQCTVHPATENSTTISHVVSCELLRFKNTSIFFFFFFCSFEFSFCSKIVSFIVTFNSKLSFVFDFQESWLCFHTHTHIPRIFGK